MCATGWTRRALSPGHLLPSAAQPQGPRGPLSRRESPSAHHPHLGGSRWLWVTKARLWGEGRRVHSEPRAGLRVSQTLKDSAQRPGPADTRRAPWRRGALAVSACVPGVGGVRPWTGSLDLPLGASTSQMTRAGWDHPLRASELVSVSRCSFTPPPSPGLPLGPASPAPSRQTLAGPGSTSHPEAGSGCTRKLRPVSGVWSRVLPLACSGAQSAREGAALAGQGC